MAPEGTSDPIADEQRLAELGYKQELDRGWTRFTNFAISFSIISVLAGCFTTFYVGWNNGGPIVISIGWPVIAVIILAVAVSMSELASAFPTAGGPYWWAHRLGGAGWSWFTGWFNVIGLIGIVASVDYVLAFFLSQLFGLWGWDWGFVNLADNQHIIQEIFWLYAVHPRAPRHDQHLLPPVDLVVHQHLGLVARARGGDHPRDPHLRPRPSPERQLRLHREDQQLRVRRRCDQRRHLLVPGAAGGLPADDVHDHRLRRLGARGRGDGGGRAGSGEGHLAVGRDLSGDRVVLAARVPLRRHPCRCRQQRASAAPSPSSPPPT